MWLRELVGLGVALPCEFVDDGPSGVSQPHHLGAFVDSLTRGIVYRLPQHLHVVVGVYLHYLRVSAAHEEAEEWQWRLVVVVVAVFYEVRHHVTLQVVHVNERYVQRTCHALGEADANE